MAFGDLVLSQDGLTVRRRRGRNDFTASQDVDSLTGTAEGGLLVTSRGSDFPTCFARSGYQVPNLEIFLDVACRLRERGSRSAPATPPPAATPATITPSSPPPQPASAEPASPASAPAPADHGRAVRDDEESPTDVPQLLALYVTFGVAAWAAWRLGTRQEVDGVGSVLLAAAGAALGGFFGAVFGLGLAAVCMAARKRWAGCWSNP